MVRSHIHRCCARQVESRRGTFVNCCERLWLASKSQPIWQKSSIAAMRLDVQTIELNNRVELNTSVLYKTPEQKQAENERRVNDKKALHLHHSICNKQHQRSIAFLHLTWQQGRILALYRSHLPFLSIGVSMVPNALLDVILG